MTPDLPTMADPQDRWRAFTPAEVAMLAAGLKMAADDMDQIALSLEGDQTADAERYAETARRLLRQIADDRLSNGRPGVTL